ncbi:hypothetical protein ABT288_48645 [Streptomyces sp. NPDC001093]|uniref:hypothetical protein n=1 Tax=Streptomyces sp. NPDC001093 TaxID=3154376 RepID=UPI00331F49D4
MPDEASQASSAVRPKHRLCERGPPRGRAETTGEVLRLVHDLLVGEFHDLAEYEGAPS